MKPEHRKAPLQSARPGRLVLRQTPVRIMNYKLIASGKIGIEDNKVDAARTATCPCRSAICVATNSPSPPTRPTNNRDRNRPKDRRYCPSKRYSSPMSRAVQARNLGRTPPTRSAMPRQIESFDTHPIEAAAFSCRACSAQRHKSPFWGEIAVKDVIGAERSDLHSPAPFSRSRKCAITASV